MGVRVTSLCSDRITRSRILFHPFRRTTGRLTCEMSRRDAYVEEREMCSGDQWPAVSLSKVVASVRVLDSPAYHLPVVLRSCSYARL